MRVLAADIETGAAEELHSYGPGFIRLCGWQEVTADPAEPIHITTDPARFTAALLSADAITGHNFLNYDLMALASQGYITFDQYEQLCLKTFDTMLAVRHLDPVAARGVHPNGYHTLDQSAIRYGVGGKSHVDFAGKIAIVRRVKGDKEADRMVASREAAARRAKVAGKKYAPAETFGVLKLLADLYGGYDKIPQDDPDYVHYLKLDVTAQRGLYLKLSALIKDEPNTSQRYLRREHYTATAMGRTTLEGCRVDTDLTMARWSEGQARLDAGKQMLHEKYGMPLEGKKPHVTNAGKAAFRAAILATGISEEALSANWPTGADGFLLTGKEVLNGFIPVFEQTKPAAAELCRTILAMNGERSVYGTVLDHVVGDRVHPYIGPDQASGRWSMKNPGLTVLGKRGGKARERAVILADSDDEVLVAIDADQVDARVVAAECQDHEYMKLFAPGMDLHSEVALRVFNRPECREEMLRNNGRCDCEYRDRAKVFGHGFSYGLGAKSMAAQHGVDVEVALRFIHGMTEAFPRLAEWKEEIRRAAGALGFGEEAPANDSYRILHTWAGRPVRVERERAYTQATALIGQGGTRDVMAEAVLKLPREYRRRVRAVIHDELVISLPKEGAQERAQSIADGMAFDLGGVAITFGCSRVSRSWAGCYGEQYEVGA